MGTPEVVRIPKRYASMLETLAETHDGTPLGVSLCKYALIGFAAAHDSNGLIRYEREQVATARARLAILTEALRALASDAFDVPQSRISIHGSSNGDVMILDGEAPMCTVGPTDALTASLPTDKRRSAEA